MQSPNSRKPVGARALKHCHNPRSVIHLFLIQIRTPAPVSLGFACHTFAASGSECKQAAETRVSELLSARNVRVIGGSRRKDDHWTRGGLAR
jgi:hypothetical protein